MWKPPWKARPRALHCVTAVAMVAAQVPRVLGFLFSGLIDERGRDFLRQFRVSVERGAPSP
jgi:hypothetical protein